MSKKTEPQSLLQMLANNVHFHADWSNQMLYVDPKGTVRVGNKLHPKGGDAKYMQHARQRGVIRNMPNELYHRERNHVSSSALKIFDENVRKYHRIYVARQESDDDQESTPDKRVGSVAHSLILDTPEVTEATFAVKPTVVDGVVLNNHKPDHRQYLKDWQAAEERLGKTVISDAEYAQGAALANAFGDNDLAMELVCADDTAREISLFGYDEKSGQRVKTRLDLLTRWPGHPSWSATVGHPTIVDIKTSQSQSPEEFIRRDVPRFGYDISGALYRKITGAFLGELPYFLWLVLSKDKRGDCQSFLVTLGNSDWMDAALAVDETLDRIATANLSDEFVSPFVNRVTVGKLFRQRS